MSEIKSIIVTDNIKWFIEDAEQLELSSIPGRTADGAATLGNNLTVSYDVKHTSTITI